MAIQQPESERALLFITAVTAWFALILQLHSTIGNSGLPLTDTVIRYFCFFKIWTNLLAAICSTVLCFRNKSRLHAFFSSFRVTTAIAVYISLGAIIYNMIIRQIFRPEGMQWVLDMLLHTVVPLLFLLYWILFTPKAGLAWNDLWIWLLFPVAYILYVLIVGTYSGFYPYPYLNAGTYGLQTVLRNSLVVMLVVIMWSGVFVGYSMLSSRFQKT